MLTVLTGEVFLALDLDPAVVRRSGQTRPDQSAFTRKITDANPSTVEDKSIVRAEWNRDHNHAVQGQFAALTWFTDVTPHEPRHLSGAAHCWSISVVLDSECPTSIASRTGTKHLHEESKHLPDVVTQASRNDGHRHDFDGYRNACTRGG